MTGIATAIQHTRKRSSAVRCTALATSARTAARIASNFHIGVVNMAASKIKVIKDFFGVREGDTAKDFMQEIKALSADERLELAQGSALNLGLSADDLDFPIE
jgi:hypothetical protein